MQRQDAIGNRWRGNGIGEAGEGGCRKADGEGGTRSKVRGGEQARDRSQLLALCAGRIMPAAYQLPLKRTEGVTSLADAPLRPPERSPRLVFARRSRGGAVVIRETSGIQISAAGLFFSNRCLLPPSLALSLSFSFFRSLESYGAIASDGE